MIRYIAIIRTSTQAQEIDSQRKELLDFIKKDGVDLKEVTVIGEAGASAIKLDERYRKNLEKVYSLIDGGGIECVYAWALDRIGRNEQVMFGFKQYLLDHGVNLKVVNPSLILRNPDGTINSGMEIAFSLYVTMSKQEMEQKKARFARARERNRKNGKFHGGGRQYVLFGYKVNSDGFVVPDEEEAAVIRMIFEMYSTGKYSLTSLERELSERGIVTRCKLKRERIDNYLRNEIYCGASDRQFYPPIVSRDIFERCASLLSTNNRTLTKQYKNSYFGVKLIRCPECGRHLVSFKDHYKCAYRYRGWCSSGIAFSVDLMDGLLWHFAKTLELNMQAGQNEENLKAYEDELAVLRQKKKTLSDKSGDIEKKMFNTKQLYAEAMITREQFESLMEKHRKSDLERHDKLLEIEEGIKAVKANIKRIKNPDSFFSDYADLGFKLASLRDEKRMSEIVHRQIRTVDIAYDKTVKRGYNVTIHSHIGTVMNISYYPNKRNGQKLYINGIPHDWKNYAIDRTRLALKPFPHNVH